MLPNGDLTIRAEYTCGCRVYLDRDRHETWEDGLFCRPETHGKTLTQGAEKQASLFEGREP